MKLFLPLFCSIVALILSSTTENRRPSAESAMEWERAAQDSAAAKQPLFVAIFSLGPNWQTDKPAPEQAYFKAHSENLKKLRGEQKIVLGARYADKGMIIVAAADEKEARAMLEADPMVMHQVFNLELHPFRPFYKGCIQ